MKFNVDLEMETDDINNIIKLFWAMKKIANEKYSGKCRVKISGEPNIILNAVKEKLKNAEKKLGENFSDFFTATWMKNY